MASDLIAVYDIADKLGILSLTQGDVGVGRFLTFIVSTLAPDDGPVDGLGVNNRCDRVVEIEAFSTGSFANGFR